MTPFSHVQIEFLISTFLSDFTVLGFEPMLLHALLSEIGWGVVVEVIRLPFKTILLFEEDGVVSREKFTKGVLLDTTFILFKVGLGLSC